MTIRFSFNSISLSIVALALLSACGPISKLPTVRTDLAKEEAHIQRMLAIEEKDTAEKRVSRIAFDLFNKSADLCDTKENTFGFRYKSWKNSNKNFNKAIHEYYKLGTYPKVTQVFQSGPAFKSGLRVGDEIVEINSALPPKNKRKRGKWLKTELEKSKQNNSTVSLHFLRDNDQQAL